jgi:hypothetical protein
VPNGEDLCDAPAHVVPHDSRALDTERIHHLQQITGLGDDVHRLPVRGSRPAVAEHVRRDETCSSRQRCSDFPPEAAMGRNPVDHQDRLGGGIAPLAHVKGPPSDRYAVTAVRRLFHD